MKRISDRDFLRRVISRFFVWALLIIALFYYLGIKLDYKYMALIFIGLFIIIIFYNLRKMS